MSHARSTECRVRLGRNVKARRMALGMSQERLSFEAGLNRAHITLIERGRREPRLETIRALACGLKITPAELLAGVFEI